MVRKWSEMDQSSIWLIKYLGGPVVVRRWSDLYLGIFGGPYLIRVVRPSNMSSL